MPWAIQVRANLAELAANDQALSPAVYTEAVLRAALAAYEAFPDSDDGAAAVAVAARVLMAQPPSSMWLGCPVSRPHASMLIQGAAANQCRVPRAPRYPDELQRMVVQVQRLLPISALTRLPPRSPRSALAWLWLAAALTALADVSPAGPAPALDALATMLRAAGPLCR